MTNVEGNTDADAPGSSSADAPGSGSRVKGHRSQRAISPEPDWQNKIPSPVPESPVPDISRLGRIFGTVVAPTTLLTALLYYFGWMHAYYFFGYFGVNSTLLGFGTTDYLMRSVDALFIPMTTTAVTVLAGLWIDGMLRGRLTGRPDDSMARILLAIMAAFALGLIVAGGISTFGYRTALNQYAAAAPLSFAVGVLLLTYAVHMRHYFTSARKHHNARSRPWAGAVEWAVIFALVGMSLFAAATDYAAAVGRSRAQQFAASISAEPDVLVYSGEDLSLHAPGVREMRCRDRMAAYKFRYEGLKLVLKSGGHYLFLPERWTPATGIAILMFESSTVRLEFYAASSHAGPQTTC